ncbi:protein of unknown function [Methylacidimicrobium sp. AP8]|uniref:hypothetical protein n=1 Tax=Methylacidimicrobium sp. AP8 TaxID=2730359 RepID=UPI0018C0569B|nr:hypothetical protein [Methylacidimicrobium sp. AP8]CAB4244268.1 protein of unknown function [Methylacidimicrobium sp. AP8]
MPQFRILSPARLLPPWLLDTLRSSVGAEIAVQTYAGEEESRSLLAGHAFELAALPDTAILPSLRENLLLPLAGAVSDPLPGEPEFLHHYFDPANRFAWPFGFTLLAIGGPGTPAEVPGHWKDLASGRIPFRPPDSRIVSRCLRAALATGFPPSPAAVAQAGPESGPAPGDARIEVDFVQQLEIRRRAGGWTVRVPSEGSWIRLFHWTLPRGCADAKAAGAVLQALYRPDNLGRATAEAMLAVTAREARQAVPAELLRNPEIYPPQSLLDLCVFARVDWLAPLAGAA